jgi:hypothetical protein
MVLWGWAKFIDADKLPPSRVVVRFDLTDRPRQRLWMLIDRPESEVCVKHPGLDEDLVVATDCVTLTDIHRGRIVFEEAIASGRMRIDGPPAPARAFQTWSGLSYDAGFDRPGLLEGGVLVAAITTSQRLAPV